MTINLFKALAITNVDGVTVDISNTPAVVGTNAADIIQSLGQLDGGSINALEGDDSLFVETRNNDSSGFVVDGNDGDDLVVIDNDSTSEDPAVGRVSSFTAFGGEGDDSIVIADLIVGAGSQLIGNSGEDSIFVDTENAVDGLLVEGNQDADVIAIIGVSSETQLPDFDNSQVSGGEGNDSIGIGTILGLVTDFTFTVQNVDNALLSGDSGDDEINVYSNTLTNSDVSGGDGSDSIVINSSNRAAHNVITGNEGDDTVLVFGPDIINSSVIGGDGNDSISTVNAFLTGGSIEGNDGEDSLSLGLLDSVAVNGNADNDAIDLRGNIVSSSIEGGQGDDIISSFIDDSIAIIDSVISGDKGDDVIGLEAGLFNSSVIGGDGNDIISTENAFVTGGSIEGNNGEDSLSLGLLDSVAVNGNADNDVIDLRGNIESSSIRGGQGNDTISSFIDDSITITDSVIAGDKGDDAIILGELNIETPLYNSTFNNASSADVDTVIDGGAGNDVIAFDGTQVEDATILGGEGADTFQLWNGGTVELTDFEAEIDTLILGNYFITTGTGTPTSALTGINWLIGASTSEGVVSSVTARIGSTTTANLGQPGSPLVSGNDWITARQDIFRLVSVNGNASGTVSGKVLFLDNQGPDAGLYVYSISKIDYLAGDKEAIFTENATTNSQTIALGNFNASDIVVI